MKVFMIIFSYNMGNKKILNNYRLNQNKQNKKYYIINNS